MHIAVNCLCSKSKMTLTVHTPTQTCMHERTLTIRVFVHAPLNFHLIKLTVCGKNMQQKDCLLNKEERQHMAICLCLLSTLTKHNSSNTRHCHQYHPLVDDRHPEINCIALIKPRAPSFTLGKSTDLQLLN